MERPTFDAFEAAAKADGFDEVLARTWPPSAILDADVPHAERYGADGRRTGLHAAAAQVEQKGPRAAGLQ